MNYYIVEFWLDAKWGVMSYDYSITRAENVKDALDNVTKDAGLAGMTPFRHYEVTLINSDNYDENNILIGKTLEL